MADPTNKYTIFQRNFYDGGYAQWHGHNKDVMVGSFNEHNQFEGFDNLFKDMDTKGKVALDFGCGPGRNIVRYRSLFARIDGVDIAPVSLEKAKLWLRDNGVPEPNLYACNGVDLKAIPDEQYDVVFSTICLQHICVYEIRFNYLKEFFRVLKPGGWVTFQMGHGPSLPQCRGYYENHYDADSTNGTCDVTIENHHQLRDDFLKVGFTDFDYTIIPAPSYEPLHIHDFWIFARGQKYVQDFSSRKLVGS